MTTNVKFSKMVSVSGMAGDDRTQNVLVDDKVVGQITSIMEDLGYGGSTKGPYHVSGYNLELWSGDDEVSEWFHPSKTVTARQALKMAQDRARTLVEAARPVTTDTRCPGCGRDADGSTAHECH